MNVEITSYLKGAALTLLKEEFQGPDLLSVVYDESKNIIKLVFKDDMLYRDMTCWIGHALGCGLITGGHIER